MDNIRATTCDVCNATKTPCVEHFHTGVPVLAACKACHPRNFEAQARADIDAWLAGGDTSAFGR